MKLLILVLCVASFTRGNDDEYCEMNEDGTDCVPINLTVNRYSKQQDDKLKEFLANREEMERVGKEETDKRMPDGLARREGIKVGHVEKVDIGDGKIVDVVTRAMKPLLFEIPDIISSEECDHIIKRAQNPEEGKMFTSKAKGGLTPSEKAYNYTGGFGKATGWFGDFRSWDKNNDNQIDFDEVISIIHKEYNLWMIKSDIEDIWRKLNVTVMDDGKLNEEEFEGLNTLGVKEVVHRMSKEDARFKTRTSTQGWLNMESSVDPLIHNIRERLVKLTGLDRLIIYGGEMLQVVNYQPHGHYHAHHDTETHEKEHIPCCHQYQGDVLESVGECKLCRYITFMLYLNDVEEGGGTAFPIADNATFVREEMVNYGNVNSDLYNLSHGCKLSNLVVTPKKGMGVLWYSHLRDPKDGWMGELDWYSLHGGCDVVRGEKWIANMWIPASYGKDRHIPSIYLNRPDYEKAEQKRN